MDVLGWIGDGLWNAFQMAWEVGFQTDRDRENFAELAIGALGVRV